MELQQSYKEITKYAFRGHHASHPVNAMRYYAYAVLESRVRSQLIALGYDPTIGFIHAYGESRATLVLDLMEPLRPVVDRIVLDFICGEPFSPADFTVRRDGVCRLNPGAAKALVGRLLEYTSRQRLICILIGPH